LIPLSIPFPGVNLGLANIITIIALIFWGLKDALLIVGLRCLIVAVLTKVTIMLLFSLSGGF
jgi:heptaprenyl diphosphate synthase